ncbi:hypothetical protein [Kitasatospora sp. NPDC093806]|uniref:hypothetical protein n=1 Tax=Kitasatospora sp. NPDC093806 TaxID=3155075 RepID=UPI00341B7C48
MGIGVLLAGFGWFAAGAGTTAGAAVRAGTPVPIVVHSDDWSGKTEASKATCPGGTTLIGGGYDSIPVTNGYNQVQDAVDTNAPSQVEPNTWVIKMHLGKASAYALCSPAGSEPPIVVASADWSGKTEVSKATCPEGTALSGGGYDSIPVTNGYNQVQDAVDKAAPSADEPNTWVVKMHLGRASAYALCTK